jgi:hypothetical protein
MDIWKPWSKLLTRAPRSAAFSLGPNGGRQRLSLNISDTRDPGCHRECPLWASIAANRPQFYKQRPSSFNLQVCGARTFGFAAAVLAFAPAGFGFS